MVNQDRLLEPETYFPLKTFVCNNCWLVQVDELEKAEAIFNAEYTYFSSFSTSWLEHARRYTEQMIDRFGYDDSSMIVEIASNDGYLLQYFKEKNIPVLGVEPTANTAAVAKEKGIDSIVDFFGSHLAEQQLKAKADLILGNNVLAHVPDINDFVKGVKLALKPNGVNTFEFPHLCKLVSENQFDTIYHEHFSYLSLTAVKTIFEAQGLTIFDVQELPTHGGSLRIFAKHSDCVLHKVTSNVQYILDKERDLGVTNLSYYQGFQTNVDQIKYQVWSFLIDAKREGKKVIGYGAAAKGNTLLNYAGIKGNDLISFVVDASPYKQGKFLPGSRIPVVGKEQIDQFKPDYILIFPWNLKTEIATQLNYCKSWGAQFVVFVPKLSVF
ncbi:class I SAM-dependent methyltransferase [Wandonia haliotis]|uniref:Class I SAM-dependent methyltransferase n=2 Tax=Wandonia haliotis TaxID=574963 RepID=A0ABN1MLF0_9FLAO